MEEKGNEVGILDTLSTWDNAGRIYRTCLFFFGGIIPGVQGLPFFPFFSHRCLKRRGRAWMDGHLRCIARGFWDLHGGQTGWQASKQAGGQTGQAAVEHFLEAFTTELYTEFMCSLTPSPQGRGSESLYSSV